MPMLDGNSDNYEILEPELQINYIKNVLNKNSKDFFGCDLTDDEWVEFIALKNRLSLKISKMVEDELKKSIHKIKTGKE